MRNKTEQEKREIVAKADAEKLLKAYDYYKDNFNPIDADWVESYELIKEEMLKRMGR